MNLYVWVCACTANGPVVLRNLCAACHFLVRFFFLLLFSRQRLREHSFPLKMWLISLVSEWERSSVDVDAAVRVCVCECESSHTKYLYVTSLLACFFGWLRWLHSSRCVDADRCVYRVYRGPTQTRRNNGTRNILLENLRSRRPVRLSRRRESFTAAFSYVFVSTSRCCQCTFPPPIFSEWIWSMVSEPKRGKNLGQRCACDTRVACATKAWKTKKRTATHAAYECKLWENCVWKRKSKIDISSCLFCCWNASGFAYIKITYKFIVRVR